MFVFFRCALRRALHLPLLWAAAFFAVLLAGSVMTPVALSSAPGPATAPTAGIAERRGPQLDGLRQVSAGAEYSCGIAFGALSCWGRNTWGQTGTGGRSATEPVHRVGGATNWKRVAAGGSTTCGIRKTGRLFCWGLNNRGQVGDGTHEVRLKPTRVKGREWKQVDVGWYHACGIRGEGRLLCWGDNSRGQLGGGSTEQRLKKTRVKGRWLKVSTEGWTTCGIRRNRTLWCWGRNLLGQVGDGTWRDRLRPVKVGGDARWRDVQLAWTQTCARRGDRTVWCWGRNDLGGLGDGTQVARNAPTRVLGDHRARALSVYEGGACLVDTSQRLWCWGDNRYGQGSSGGGADGGPVTYPVQRPGAFKRLSSGWMHTCGVTERGVRCWGSNERGQLGYSGSAARPAYPRTVASYDAARGRVGARARRDDLTFRLATYNILGDHMTAPYGVWDQWAPGRMRAEWAVQYIANQGIDVLGIQEGSAIQTPAILRASGGRLAAFPDPRVDDLHPESAVVWDRNRFDAVEKHVIRTISNKKRLPRPYVLLRDRATGREFWVMSIHNASGNRQKKRNEAMRDQLEVINRLEETGKPVYYVGDFNETDTAACKVMRNSDLVAAQGGRITADGTCIAPRPARILWLFGSQETRWSGFEYSGAPLVRLTTDHQVPVVSVRVP